MPKQLINIIGVVVIIAVVVAGSVLVALPMFLQSLSTTAEAVNVASTNTLYEQRVATLHTEEARLDEISADVVALRAQIPSTLQNDDVFEIVADAAAESGATVTTVTVSDPSDWVLPAAPVEEGAVPVEEPATDTEEGAAPADGTEQAADATADDGAGEDVSAGGVTSPQMQVPFSIAVRVDQPQDAARFIDALGAGPRLIAVESTTLELEEDESGDVVFNLKVEVLALVRTES